MKLKCTFAILFFCGICNLGSGQTSWKNNQLILENDKMVHVLSFRNNQVIPEIIFSKEHNRNVLNKSDETPWFEFVVNHKLLKSTDPIWKYQTHSTRKLNNGGEEVRIILEATKIVKGLQLEIYRQYFPGSSMIRERILLKTSSRSFELNKLNDRLHFIFPQYSLQAGIEKVDVEEIRIATFGDELLENFDPGRTYDDRKFDHVGDINLAHCHMFHPKLDTTKLANNSNAIHKGPFCIYTTPDLVWMSTYEHASQDKNFGTEHAQAKSQSTSIANDQQQGVEGKSGLSVSDEDFWFLGLKSELNESTLSISLNQLHGGYLDGERIDNTHPYETVWATSSFFRTKDEIKPAIHNYLWKNITENPASRKSHYYYNTWGMQRDNNNKIGLREIFTENRILEEIRNAAQLKVDLFVLDDGWEQTMGEWQPHKTRFPNGLEPLITEMKKNNIIPGAWLSPMGIDSLSERFKNNPEWIIRDETGSPIKAQWGFPAFDFVSDFYDLFVNDCKKLVDQGIRFFKWDAINTFDSTLPGLRHGTSSYSKLEIRDRYAYLLPFYVTRAMKELREYNEDVTVEIDLTEKERCMIGLMPLQEGKFFWMNNGGSGYNDYSTYRTKSMRTVFNQYVGIMPTELFTQAVYPQNVYPFFAQRYNVNTTLVAGHGFWGNLNMMKPEQRIRAGNLVEKSKRILPYIIDLPIEVSGNIGSSPEIYTHVNKISAAGQVIAFSGSAVESPATIQVNTENCLGVINHSFSTSPSSIHIAFQFTRPDDTREAFILPNQGTGIGIESCTGWIEDLKLDIQNKSLIIVPGNQGEIIIRIPTVYSEVEADGKMLNQQSGDNTAKYRRFKLVIDRPLPVKLEWK